MARNSSHRRGIEVECPICKFIRGNGRKTRTVPQTRKHLRGVHNPQKIQADLRKILLDDIECTVCGETFAKASMMQHFLEQHRVRKLIDDTVHNTTHDEVHDQTQDDFHVPESPPNHDVIFDEQGDSMQILQPSNTEESTHNDPELEKIDELRQQFLARAFDFEDSSDEEEEFNDAPAVTLSSIIGNLANDIDEPTTAIKTFTLQDYRQCRHKTLIYNKQI